jgi:hypothetical protein
MGNEVDILEYFFPGTQCLFIYLLPVNETITIFIIYHNVKLVSIGTFTPLIVFHFGKLLLPAKTNHNNNNIFIVFDLPYYKNLCPYRRFCNSYSLSFWKAFQQEVIVSS